MPKMLRVIARAHKHGWRSRRGVVVYAFHGVAQEIRDGRVEHNHLPWRKFRESVEFFRRQRGVGLDEILHALEGGHSLRSKGYLLTFDDGYQNNIPVCEELAKMGIPAVVFVPAGDIGRGGTIWTSEVTALILRGGREWVDLDGRRWDLRTEEKRVSAARMIRQELKSQKAGNRRRLVAELVSQYPKGRVEELLEEYPNLKLMDWNGVRYLAELGIAIGSHGLHHEILHAEQEPKAVREELFRSKTLIERETGKTCLSFAYPNGDWAPEWLARLEEAGYRLAFTTRDGAVQGRENPLTLPRANGGGVEGNMRDFYYEAEPGGR